MLKKLVTLKEFISQNTVIGVENVDLKFDMDSINLETYNSLTPEQKTSIRIQKYLNQAGMQVNSLTNNRIYEMWDYLNKLVLEPTLSEVDKNDIEFNLNTVKTIIIQWVEYFIYTNKVFADTTVEAPSNMSLSINGQSKNADIERKRIDLIVMLDNTMFVDRVASIGSVRDIESYNPYDKWITNDTVITPNENIFKPHFKSGEILEDTMYYGLENKTNIETLTTKIGELQEWVNSNTVLDKEQADLIKNNLSQIQTNTQNITNNSNQINTHQQEITKIQQINTNQDNSISSLNLLTTTHTQDITTLNNGLDTANNRIANNATNTQQNTTQLQALLNTIKQQQALIKELQNDLIALEKVLKTANIIVYRGHYDTNTSYRLGDTVTASEDNNILYLSLQDSNLNNSLDNKEYWLKIGATSTVDLSNYFTKQQILNLFITNLANYANLTTTNTFTKTQTFSDIVVNNTINGFNLTTINNNDLNINNSSNNVNLYVSNNRLIKDIEVQTIKSDLENSINNKQNKISYFDITGKQLDWDRTSSATDYCYIYSTHYTGDLSVLNGMNILSWCVFFDNYNVGNNGINVNVCPTMNYNDSWYGLNVTIVTQQGSNKKGDHYNDVLNGLTIRIYYISTN